MINIAPFFERFFNKTYDLYIPFGRSCHCTMILRENNLRICSMPFDWLIPIEYDKEPMEYRFALFNDISDFFNKEDYVFNRQKITTSGHYSVYNKKFGFEIGHDFKVDLTDSENLFNFKIKYLRRYKKMWNLIENSNRICFVYMSKTMDQMGVKSDLDMNIIEKNLKILNQRFFLKVFDFVVFEHDDTLSANKIKIKRKKNIVKYISNHSIHINDNLLSETLSINKVLKSYNLTCRNIV